jgi:hypothetical protein
VALLKGLEENEGAPGPNGSENFVDQAVWLEQVVKYGPADR